MVLTYLGIIEPQWPPVEKEILLRQSYKLQQINLLRASDWDLALTIVNLQVIKLLLKNGLLDKEEEADKDQIIIKNSFLRIGIS